MKIRSKLHLAILPAVLVVFGGLAWLNWIQSRDAVVAQIEKNARGMIDAAILDIDGRMKLIEQAGGILGRSVEATAPSTAAAVGALIQAALAVEPDAYGSTVAFAPGSFAEGIDLVGPYYHRGPSGLVYVDLATPAYNYPAWDWFKVPMESRQPRWSEPYRDVGGGNVLMTTYSFPFSRAGAAWGVATMDVALADLTKIITSLRVGDRGYVFLISADGTFLSQRREEWERQATIFDAARQFGSGELEALGHEMTAGGKGFAPMFDPLNGEPSWFAYGPILRTGWSLAVVLPQSEVLAPIASLQWRAAAVACAGLAVIFVIILAVARRITDPLAELADAARKVAGGNLVTKIAAVSSRDEVGQLAAALAEMQASTADAIEALREEKATFAAAFARTSDALVIVNARWQVLQQNPAAEKLLGVSRGTALLDHLDERYEGSVPLLQLGNAAQERAAFSMQRKGERSRFACSVEPIRGEGGGIRERVFCARELA